MGYHLENYWSDSIEYEERIGIGYIYAFGRTNQ